MGATSNQAVHSRAPKAPTLCHYLPVCTMPSSPACLSMAAAVFEFFFNLFFLAAVGCQHNLCDWNKDNSFKSNNRSERSPTAHLVIVHDRGAESHIGSDCIECFVEWYYVFFYSRQVRTLNLCHCLGLVISPSFCIQSVYLRLRP